MYSLIVVENDFKVDEPKIPRLSSVFERKIATSGFFPIVLLLSYASTSYFNEENLYNTAARLQPTALTAMMVVGWAEWRLRFRSFRAFFILHLLLFLVSLRLTFFL